MSTRRLSWSFNLSVQSAIRLPVLNTRTTFERISKQIAADMKVLCCHPSEMDGTGFKRPVYTVFVGHPLFDLFFNSPAGYRAAYFRSPGLGLDANNSFMHAVADRLIADPLSTNSTFTLDFIRESLLTPSAKAWLVEHGKELDAKCPGCKGEWGSGSAGEGEVTEILNGRWETASGQKAEWGRKAPYLTKIRLMGAFINERHHELVPFDKRLRAHDIHEYGWS